MVPTNEATQVIRFRVVISRQLTVLAANNRIVVENFSLTNTLQ